MMKSALDQSGFFLIGQEVILSQDAGFHQRGRAPVRGRLHYHQERRGRPIGATGKDLSRVLWLRAVPGLTLGEINTRFLLREW